MQLSWSYWDVPALAADVPPDTSANQRLFLRKLGSLWLPRTPPMTICILGAGLELPVGRALLQGSAATSVLKPAVVPSQPPKTMQLPEGQLQ